MDHISRRSYQEILESTDTLDVDSLIRHKAGRSTNTSITIDSQCIVGRSKKRAGTEKKLSIKSKPSFSYLFPKRVELPKGRPTLNLITDSLSGTQPSLETSHRLLSVTGKPQEFSERQIVSTHPFRGASRKESFIHMKPVKRLIRLPSIEWADLPADSSVIDECHENSLVSSRMRAIRLQTCRSLSDMRLHSSDSKSRAANRTPAINLLKPLAEDPDNPYFIESMKKALLMKH